MAGFGVGGVVALRQPLHFQVFSHSKEGIELFLSNIHLAVIHKVQDGDKVGILDAFQVQKRIALFDISVYNIDFRYIDTIENIDIDMVIFENIDIRQF